MNPPSLFQQRNLTNNKSHDTSHHWLYPFRHKIKEVTIIDENTLFVIIGLTIEEIELNFNQDILYKMGIEEINIDTPVEFRYPNWLLPKGRHTGDMIVSLTININKSHNQKILELYGEH